ncbi:uncharacterized protein [Arachis hypogaea]|uniref:uncharacterized protein n=1 Tax=Arachis hypogaea TaxID=3818 RepID=UPI000DEC29DE|nr:uncharacterized protein LOC112742914 [Arachis hypogaea]
MAPRPFAQWGVDLLGPFPPRPGQVKYLIVAIDYYTKWVEAEPLASISSANCQNFMWRQVVTRFGIPEIVISDNGTQFTDKKFKEFLSGLRIKQKTSPQSSTGKTPFRLTYGVDAVIPVEIGEPSPRLLLEGGNEAVEKDLIDETRQMAHLTETEIKQRIALRYNGKVLKRSLKEGDLVLGRNDIGLPTPGEGKLAANWEGPYRVREVLSKGAYKLERLDGSEVPRTWNMANLKSVTAAYENLREQVRIIAPEADLTLFILENIVRDGKVVPDDEEEDDVDPPPVASTKVSTSAVSAEVGPPASDPDCQILNRDDGTVDAVPLQTRPPSPQPDAAKKSSDP